MGSGFRPLLALVVASTVLTISSTMFTPSHGLAAAQADWSPLGEEDGVRIYRRDIPGTSLYEFRGVGEVKASMAKIISIISEPSKMPRWLEGCIHGELVDRNYTVKDPKAPFSSQYSVFYAITKSPWPLHNRDYVIKSHVVVTPATPSIPAGLTVDTQTIDHPKYPPVKSMVRLPLMRSKLAMTPLGGGNERTEVDFSVVLDPGGNIPDFVVNFISHDLPLKTLSALNDLVKDNDYNHELERLIQHHYDISTGAKPVPVQ